MNADSIYKYLVEKIKETELKIKNRDDELWKAIKELAEDDFPDELPSDCLMFVSDWFYDQIKLKLCNYPPDFIKKSAMLERSQVILMKKPQDEFAIRF
jgi:hypothetical protein